MDKEECKIGKFCGECDHYLELEHDVEDCECDCHGEDDE